MAQCGVNMTIEELTLWEYTNASWAFVTMFVPLVVLFGLVSNCAFIFVVYRVKFMRNITNVYLVNLAIADSSLLLVGFIQYVGDYIICPEYDLRFSFYTSFGCAVPNFMIYLCYYASLWTVTLVTMERYLAICHTFWHRMVSNHTRSVRMVITVWIVSLFFAGFASPYSQSTLCALSDNDNGTEIVYTATFCIFTCDWCVGALYMTDSIQFVFTLVVNFVMYAMIIYHLGKSVFPISNDESNVAANMRTLQTRHQVAKMLVINGLLFFICLTPFSIANIENLIKHFDASRVFSERVVVLLSWAGRVLFLINSAINPLVYSASNMRYRMAFKQAFGYEQKVKFSRQSSFSVNQTNNTSLRCTFSQMTKV